MQNHIFLIGFMGSGKTYWGRKLAARYGAPFIDLDDIIEETASRTIPEIFDALGEDAFRQLESDCLKNLPANPASVVACGGGTPCFFDNMDWMIRHGKTIYLKTDPGVLAKRLILERAHRPLLAGLTEAELEGWIDGRLRQRAAFYERSAVVLIYQSGQEEAFWEDLQKSVIDNPNMR